MSVDSGTKLDRFARRYAFRYAFIYTSILAVILALPLYVYYTLLASLDEARTAVELGEHGERIIRIMEQYDPNREPYFKFPRYLSYQAGLYDANFKPVFTLLTFPLTAPYPGYNKEGAYRYTVIPLPGKRYFGADYLVVAKEYDRLEILQKVVLIASSILVVIFALSLFVLYNFARPFQKMNRILDDYIKDSVHEIKTPLSIISLNVDLYRQKHGESSHLSQIKAAAKTLATIYDDMEYMIKKERVPKRKESLDFGAFLRQRVNYFTEVAALRNIRIEMEIEPDIYLYFTPAQLQRIVDNTLSNAIKYSHEESVVRVGLDYEEGVIRFWVQDFGIGIKDPSQIFHRYYREYDVKGGFGIGLAIVKSIIDQEDIRLQVDSVPGEGSTFTYFFSTP